MALVLLTVVLLSSQLRIHIAENTASRSKTLAKESARLGFLIALGTLQKAAGPDQRVTARAEIFSDEVSDGERFWTGVWDTDDPTRPPLWLVSGQSADPETPASPGQSLVLVGQASTDLTGSSYVDQIIRVPVDTIIGSGGQPIAKIGWWIGDEGMKASIGTDPLTNRMNPNFLDDAEVNATELQVANVQGIEALFDDYNRFEFSMVEKLEQIGFVEDLKFLDSFSESDLDVLSVNDLSETPFHSLTPRSFGVLANTLPASDPDSGLMRDLSLFPKLLGDGLAHYLAFGEAAEGNLSGLGIDGLRLRTRVRGLDVIGELEDGEIALPVSPILTNFMIAFTIRSQSPVSDHPNFYLRMRFFCEFWNPFTHSLELVGADGVEQELELEISGLPSVTVQKTTGTPTSSAPINIQTLVGDLSRPGNPLVIRLGYDHSEDWLPGQSMNWTGVDASTAVGASPYTSVEREGKKIAEHDHNLGGATGIDTGEPRLSGKIRHTSVGSNELVIKVFLVNTDTGDRELVSELNGLRYEPVSTRLTGYSNDHSGTTFGYHFLLRGPHHSSNDSEYFRGRWLFDHDPRNVSPSFNPDWNLDNDPEGDIGSAYVPVKDGVIPLLIPDPSEISETANSIEISDFRRLHDRSLGSYGTLFNRLWQDAPLFELPRQRILSLAALQHVYFHNERPLQVGNSWGSFGEVNTSAWFDRYYFSGFSRNDDSAIFVKEAGPPNPTLFSLDSFDDSQLTIWQSVDPDNVSASKAPAEHLMVANRFNLNSTSVPAWKVVLGSLRLDGWTFLDYPEEDTSDLSDLTLSTIDRSFTFSRFSHSLSETYEATKTPSFEGTEPVAPSAFYRHGARRLTKNQLQALASEIVRLIKLREKPFMSMESFIEADSSGQSLLEKAIDNVLAPEGRQKWHHDWEMFGESAALLSDGIDIDHFSPGFLTQADVLTAIGPMLSTRSDTFKIRVRGQAIEGSGSPHADAVLEAVVQRMPSLANPGGSERFGRTFKVVSLKWIEPSKI